VLIAFIVNSTLVGPGRETSQSGDGFVAKIKRYLIATAAALAPQTRGHLAEGAGRQQKNASDAAAWLRCPLVPAATREHPAAKGTLPAEQPTARNGATRA
jgi:hypothetical protein